MLFLIAVHLNDQLQAGTSVFPWTPISSIYILELQMIYATPCHLASSEARVKSLTDFVCGLVLMKLIEKCLHLLHNVETYVCP